MDDRLQQALSFANYKQTLNNQLEKLRISTKGQLIYAEAGGKFTINRELICFFDYLVRIGKTEAPIIDDNGSPILISDVNAFLEKITTRYYDVVNDYVKQSKQIKKSRDVRSVLDIKELE